MILTILISIIAGYVLARIEIIQRILSRFRFEEPDELDEMPEESNNEPEKEKVRIINNKHISIYKKQKRGRAARYYPDRKHQFVCDYVTYKNGVLVCHLKDSVMDEEFNIKDIDEFII